MPEGARTVVVREAFEIVGGVLVLLLEDDDDDVLIVLPVLLLVTMLVSTGGGGRTLNCGTFAPMLNPLILSALAFKAGNGQV